MDNNGAFFWNIEKIISKGDYNYAIVRNHPNRTKNDYVLMHRVIVENHLGRLLNKNEIVHHINGDKKDNRIENLEVHLAHEHSRSHGLQKGRVYLELICPSCKKVFEKEKRKTHVIKKGVFTACSNSCRGKFSRRIQIEGRTKEVEEAISVNILSEFRKYFEDNTEVTHL